VLCDESHIPGIGSVQPDAFERIVGDRQDRFASRAFNAAATPRTIRCSRSRPLVVAQPHSFEGFGAGAKNATPDKQATSVACNPSDLRFKGDPALELTPESSERDHRISQVPTLADARLEVVQMLTRLDHQRRTPSWP
jgi:hypothetical protein